MADNTLLMYAESGCYKTSNIGELADYFWSNYGGITRLITADSGVGPAIDQIQRGVIQPWDIRGVPQFAAVLRMAARGYWPKKIDQNFKGDLNTLAPTLPKDWAGIACSSFEGLTKFADEYKHYLLSEQRETGEPLVAKFEERGIKFASSSRGTFKFIQEQIMACVSESCSLPVKWVVWTGHEGKGEDQVSKRTIFGPAVAGKALTEKMTSCFQHSLHLESFTDKVKTKDGAVRARTGVRAFFERHPDVEVTGVFWPAKLGVSPFAKVKILGLWPGGSVPLTLIVGEDGEPYYQSSVASLVEQIDGLEGRKRNDESGD